MEIKNRNMETRIELLKKLGFSHEYLNILKEGGQTHFKSIDVNSVDVESLEQSNTDLTSLIIEKTDKTLSSDFIYNEQ